MIETESMSPVHSLYRLTIDNRANSCSNTAQFEVQAKIIPDQTVPDKSDLHQTVSDRRQFWSDYRALKTAWALE